MNHNQAIVYPLPLMWPPHGSPSFIHGSFTIRWWYTKNGDCVKPLCRVATMDSPGVRKNRSGLGG